MPSIFCVDKARREIDALDVSGFPDDPKSGAKFMEMNDCVNCTLGKRELHQVAEDFGRSKSPAEEHPEKLAELQQLFGEQASPPIKCRSHVIETLINKFLHTPQTHNATCSLSDLRAPDPLYSRDDSSRGLVGILCSRARAGGL